MPPAVIVPKCAHCETDGPDTARKWGLCRVCYGTSGIRAAYRDGRPVQSRDKHITPHKRSSTSPAPPRKIVEKPPRKVRQQKSFAEEEAQLQKTIAEQMQNLPDWWYDHDPEPDTPVIL